jgi:hypothetical protein
LEVVVVDVEQMAPGGEGDEEESDAPEGDADAGEPEDDDSE